ncbi:MAG: hypothetical protein KDC12_00580 [Flavobacteriales bacterium]|nr:hypothetical protein [Flavobacteriales bacterium]
MNISLRKHFNVLLVLTVAMSVIKGFFAVNDLVDHPQFTLFECMSQFYTTVENASRGGWFYTFFACDLIWSAVLLRFIHRLIIKWNGVRLLPGGSLSIWRMPLALLFIAAYALDTAENIGYCVAYAQRLSNPVFLSYLLQAKLVAYGLCVLILFITAYIFHIHDRMRELGRFVASAAISLIIVTLIALILTQMDQGSTIVIHLLDERPLNLAIVFILMTFLGIILSHYPMYFESHLFSNKGPSVQWVMARKRRFLGFGVIFFNYNTKPVDGSNSFIENAPQHLSEHRANTTDLSEHLRRLLGILIHLAVMYILFFVGEACFGWRGLALGVTALAAILGLKFYLYWQRPENLETHEGYDHPRPVKLAKAYPWIMIGHIIIVALTMVLSFWLGWSRMTLLSAVLACFSGMIAFLTFRITRSTLKFVYFNVHGTASNAMWGNADPDHFNDYTGPWKGLFKLSNNLYYLFYLQNVGWATLTLVLFIVFVRPFAVWLNPLPMLLAFIVVGYSVVTLYIKHILLYKQPNQEGLSYDERFKVYNWLLPLAGIILVIWSVFATSVGNDLHIIQPTPEDPEHVMSLADYQSIAIEEQRNCVIASYGGGLKADLWNLLLFDDLQRNSNDTFLNRALCMSGVSGGGMGIANFQVLATSGKERKAAIDTVGNYNFLSIDISMAFGLDLLQELIPWRAAYPYDRSYVAMQKYAELCGLPEGKSEVSFRNLWYTEMRDHGLPPLLINTVSTNGIHGIAASVGRSGETIVPGSIDILESFDTQRPNSSLPYYGATSTCNRFPIFSPAARLKGLGHFMDGGYYDNSGLLAAYSFYNRILNKSGTDKNLMNLDSLAAKTLLTSKTDGSSFAYEPIIPVFLSISNSQSWYIHQQLEAWKIRWENEANASEIAAILQTVASIDKIPNYFAAYLDRHHTFREIAMPHYMTYDGACAVLGNTPNDPFILMNLICEHNTKIIEALQNDPDYDYDKWGIVVPPLARLLSKPAVEYQKAMISHHRETRALLDSLIMK